MKYILFAALTERSFINGCTQSSDNMKLFDKDESTFCSTDASATDAILVGFQTTATASGLRFTMEGYAGTIWGRTRTSNGQAVDTEGKFSSCIGGSWWDNPTASGASDVEIKVTSGKATYELSLGGTKTIDCLAISMSDHHGSPNGKYEPQPKIYEMDLF